jgi:hypothetical protein
LEVLAQPASQIVATPNSSNFFFDRVIVLKPQEVVIVLELGVFRLLPGYDLVLSQGMRVPFLLDVSLPTVVGPLMDVERAAHNDDHGSDVGPVTE